MTIDIDGLARECGATADDYLYQFQPEPRQVYEYRFSPDELIAYTRAALEEAAKVAENGRFLYDDSAEARFGKSCAAAIRRLMP